MHTATITYKAFSQQRLGRFLSPYPIDGSQSSNSGEGGPNDGSISIAPGSNRGTQSGSSSTTSVISGTLIVTSNPGKEIVPNAINTIYLKYPTGDDFAIMIAFPEKTADVTPLGQIVDTDNDGELEVGHAGVIIVNADTGDTRYFDFGRYNDRTAELGERPDGYGIVRSSATVSSLWLPSAVVENGTISNVDEILDALKNKQIFSGYGKMTAGLVKGLNYNRMKGFATKRESKGYMKFGCPLPQYCAKFARDVVRAGALFQPVFPAHVFTGQQNVNNSFFLR
ncbi:MAG: hypothetical protein PF448_06900 [Bacteroidales bacterium]|nr:hypothetical protein [Bacteroidales bacterium]